MRYTSFDDLIRTVSGSGEKSRCAVVAAEDRSTLEAVVRALEEGLIEPILIGDRAVIEGMLRSIGSRAEGLRIRPAADHDAALREAIELVRAGEADCLMKGLIKSESFLRAVMKKENGLKRGGLVSLLSIKELPTYHKLLAFTDAGICMYPDLGEKRQIIENAVESLASMGVDNPKVGVLAAVEVVNPRMPETVDAAELKAMNQRGEIGGCIVEGPISYDLAVSAEAARTKGYESPVAGDADLLVFPNITAGNIAAKAIEYTSRSEGGVLMIGTTIPVVFCSRSASTLSKYRCIALAAANNLRRG